MDSTASIAPPPQEPEFVRLEYVDSMRTFRVLGGLSRLSDLCIEGDWHRLRGPQRRTLQRKLSAPSTHEVANGPATVVISMREGECGPV